MATVSNFPTTDLGGPYPLKVVPFPDEYPVVDYEFEDGGYECNVSPCGVKRWQIIYEGLTGAQAAVLDDHFDEAKKDVNDFTYTTREGVVYTGCHYEEYVTAKHKLLDIQARTLTIARYF